MILNQIVAGNGKEDQFVEGTLSGVYNNPRISTIGPYAFAAQSITSVNMPNCTILIALVHSLLRARPKIPVSATPHPGLPSVPPA